jgi:hypothetical protein
MLLGLWCLIAELSPFGDYANWGFALALLGVDDLTLGVAWIFGSVPGGAFCFSVIVSSIIYLLRRYMEIYHPDPRVKEVDDESKPATPVFLASESQDCKNLFIHPIAFVVYILMLIYGFGNVYQTFAPYPGMFYQRPIVQFAPETVQMSCLINGTLNSTIDHLTSNGRNSKLVFWSEQSVSVDNEEEFLTKAKEISKLFNVYLGLTYKLNSSTPRYLTRSMFTLIAPPIENSRNSTATIGFRYQKANPVPYVEQTVEPGPETISFVDTPFGRIGGSMCVFFYF